ncbi:DNA topoisomerase III [Hafnia paralvei ATCC 29927]|uniref:type IA DNA topoisomerase n=1 Tax=Hafnia paralvei TaxID=546367 RepID=UPI0007E3235C|nr:type IA DNA topoisomerase [Hafnia paralvei]OAT35720.1 DNA topoisomerase III [Hafnia paralvei ATCC 29927]
MRLFIAEKPSLAKAIFEGLGGNPDTEKQNGYFQHGNDAVTWCFGHMLELYDPEDYDEKYKKWQFSDLPIKTTFPPTYKIKADSKAQTNIILSLIKQADSIVHAGDPDEEGCLLVDEILVYAGNRKPVERLLVSDLNLAPVQKSLANMQLLKPGDKFSGMTKSALSRSLLDQTFGYNMTRGSTLKGREKGYDGVLNVGRVQSAVLGLVNMRTLANQNHTESFYYDVSANLEIGGKQVKAKYQTTDSDQVDEKKRLISEAQAKHITERITGKDAVVTIATTKPENTKPPLPLNLSTLQQICAKRYGYKAARTLEIMQALYETHKLLTYPRTDNRFLSDEHYYQVGDISKAILDTMPELATATGGMNKELKHKAFDASKIEAHHAIVPTTKNGAGIKLTEEEKNVYRLVAVHYIGLFYEDAIRDKTKIHFDIKGDTFTATQSVLVQKGWETLGKDSDDDDASDDTEQTGFDLSTLKFSDSGLCKSGSVDKKKTTPPKYFTESTLLAAMTRAAKFIDDPELRKALEAKDKDSTDQGSIGTEATRAGILEKLAANAGLISIEKEKGYSELVWKTTKQGQEFCAALPKEVIQPDISARWAEKQAQIKAGTLTIEAFIQENEIYISGLIDNLAKNGINISSNAAKCPVCNKGFLRKRKGQKGDFWGCTCYPECKTTFPDKNGKPVTEKQQEGVATRLSVACPSCSKEIIINPKGFFCTGCEFKIWKTLAGKVLTDKQAETIISKGVSGEIKGFTSTKTNKEFSAKVKLEDKNTGKLVFEFLPKKA